MHDVFTWWERFSLSLKSKKKIVFCKNTKLIHAKWVSHECYANWVPFWILLAKRNIIPNTHTTFREPPHKSTVVKLIYEKTFPLKTTIFGLLRRIQGWIPVKKTSNSWKLVIVSNWRKILKFTRYWREIWFIYSSRNGKLQVFQTILLSPVLEIGVKFEFVYILNARIR